MAQIPRDKEYLNEQYNVLFLRYNALELDLDDLRNEKDKETIKLAKYEEVIKQYESDMEILKSQVVHKPYWLISDLIPKKYEKFEFSKNFVTMLLIGQNGP